jgi:hypothetical protein
MHWFFAAFTIVEQSDITFKEAARSEQLQTNTLS